MADRTPVRSLPAVQWNTAGSASGAARTSRAARDLAAGVAERTRGTARPGSPGRRSNSSASGSSSDEGEVVEGHRMGVDVEPAALELLARPQVDDRADAEGRA